MLLERTDDEIIIRLPATFNIEELENMIDYMQYKSIVSKSKATQEQADELAHEAKKNIWERIKKERNIA
jgi:hypothetical protein